MDDHGFDCNGGFFGESTLFDKKLTPPLVCLGLPCKQG